MSEQGDSICSAPNGRHLQPCPLLRPIWHIDPDDGEVFPQRDAYCFDVSFRHGVNTREIKRIWELNRLQFLVPLAAYAALIGGPSGFELVGGLVRSWMDGNPPFRGLNWAPASSLHLRVISVALCLSMIGVERLDEETRQVAPQFLFGACLLDQTISLASFIGEQSSNCRACRPYRRHDHGAGRCRGADDRARSTTGAICSSKSTARFTRTESAPSKRRPIPHSPSSCSWSRPLPTENSTICRRPP